MNAIPVCCKKLLKYPSVLFLLFSVLVATGCSVAPPAGVQVVSQFEVSRYLGRWYEIARLDHSFERGLTDVSANYRPRDDGGLEVLNRGFDPRTGQWREATGKAYFIGATDTASLKVSFFGPFYGGYHVVALDRDNYQWAMVIGPDRDYLWILSRTPNLAGPVQEHLLAQARSLGIDPSKLIWVSHKTAR